MLTTFTITQFVWGDSLHEKKGFLKTKTKKADSIPVARVHVFFFLFFFYKEHLYKELEAEICRTIKEHLKNCSG